MGTNLEEGKERPSSKNFVGSETPEAKEQYVSSYLVEAVEEEDKGERHQLVVFPVGDESFAIPIHEVKEVISMPTLTPIPQSPKYILGVTNVRGTVHAVLDLGVRLDLTREEDLNVNGYALVLEHEEIKVALNVSRVPETIGAFDIEIDRSSAVVSRSQRDQPYIKGLISQGDRIITLVDLTELTQVSESEGNEQNLL